ncbi:MAG: hypothetical protein JO197_06735 [Acidobacteria bacterium]|nr:hypothetical protein [Acidobacteriota bacterium]MBV9477550.1 hypothetical protein [Acidobacteriota bacterium]
MTTPLPPIAAVTTIDEVIASIQSIIDWSIANASRLGYFAALYKRITLAIRNGIQSGLFDDGPRMERFDVTFASRYFAALNAYFYPAQYPPISHCWRIAFDGAQQPAPILVQHMLAGINAHIDLDLGIAAEVVAPGALLPSLHHDFNTVNAVLASQTSTVVDEIDSLSPVLAELYDLLMKYELDLIADGLVVVRDAAWDFAKLLAFEPAILHPASISLHDLEVAQLGALILHPPALLANIVAAIASQESRDIVKNIQTLDGIANHPAPMTKAAAAKI